jgi:hypothetical protein
MALTQILVVRPLVEERRLDPALELGSRQHLSDVLVVTDHYCFEAAKVQAQDLCAVFLGQLVAAYVSKLETVQQ